MSTEPGLKGKDHITWLVLTFLVTCTFCQVQKDENTIVIKVNDGHLRGNVETSRASQEYYAFLGVPYGSAPDRFEVKKQSESNKEQKYTFKIIQCIGFIHKAWKAR